MLFTNIEDMTDTEIDEAYKLYSKLIKFTCQLGFHSVIEHDGETFCLICNDESGKSRKDNFITKWLKERYELISDIYHDLHDPYANY